MAKIQKTESNFKKNFEKQGQSPPVNFGTIRPFVQNVVLCNIFENYFSLLEQIVMRRVCRLWQDNVERIWAKERSLVLNIKENPMKPLLSTNLRQRNVRFAEFDLPNSTKGVELTIGKNHWKCPTIDLLGDLFHDIEHLTIFYELSPEFETTENLFYIIQKFTKVKSFSLITPQNGNVRLAFLGHLFEIINEHIGQLNSLRIYLPHYGYISDTFPSLKSKHFHKTLSMLQNFSLNSTVENLFEILQSMGKSLSADCPMKSLSINVRHMKSRSQIKTLFKKNRNLSKIKRLVLQDLNFTSSVKRFIKRFTQLESLYLSGYSRLIPNINFSVDLIPTLNKLPYLKELYLWNFRIEFIDDGQSLPNILKLTIVAQYCFRTDCQLQFNYQNGLYLFGSVEPNLLYGRFLNCFARQFPNLEQLTFRLFEGDFVPNFSNLCFAHFEHLKNLRLIDNRNSNRTFRSRMNV